LDTLKKAVLVPGREHFFVNDNIKITIPANALYDSLNFHFQVLPKLKNSYTEVYQVHNPDVPLHNSIELKIKSDNIPLNLKDKLVIASISGNAYNAYSTEWNGEWASSFISGFGNYTIVADTIKPEITFMGTSTNGKLDTNSIIRIKIEDKLSGIKSYNGYFNNEWVVFEYDAKNNMVYHYIEPQRLKTENILRFEVIDKVGNKNSIERKLNRI
jgi:hypothetical protein